VPVKARLTAVFAVAIAVVLVAAGLFVYLRFRAELNRSIDQSLRSRAAEAASVATAGGSTGNRVRPLGGLGETVAQVLDRRGRLIAGTRGFTSRPLVGPADLPPPRTAAIFRDGPVAGVEGTTRLIIDPTRASGQPAFAIAGASLSDRDDSLGDLLTLLVIGGAAALALASLAGYRLAAGALRPVESMRRRAAEISHLGSGRRLPVPDRSDEIGRLGTTLNEMLARLDAAIERERLFIADASHELRSPLTILRGELELARAEGRSADELRAAVASAADETDRLCRLADDLLLIARSQEGELSLRREDVDAAELLERIAARFRAQAVHRGRRVVTAAPPGLVVRGDRTRLEQAVGNLLDNALRHGGGEVRVSAAAIDGTIRLAVADHGPGFPDAFLGRAFERFSRADESRGEAGTGLGLAIVDVIARAHGGRAGVANEPGGGASAWIDLPAL
jgi:signal transduction histidine kinase